MDNGILYSTSLRIGGVAFKFSMTLSNVDDVDNVLETDDIVARLCLFNISRVLSNLND